MVGKNDFTSTLILNRICQTPVAMDWTRYLLLIQAVEIKKCASFDGSGKSEMGSAFIIPGQYTKNGEDKLVVPNRVARIVIERQRGKDPDIVFEFKGHAFVKREILDVFD